MTNEPKNESPTPPTGQPTHDKGQDAALAVSLGFFGGIAFFAWFVSRCTPFFD